MTVKDGRITSLAYPDNQWLTNSTGIYLSTIGQLDQFESCYVVLDGDCGRIQMDHIDDMTTWFQTQTIVDSIEGFVTAWSAGSCKDAVIRDFEGWNLAEENCPLELHSLQMGLGAQVELGDCSTASYDEAVCELRYTDAMTEAAGLDPIVNMKVFTGWSVGEGPVVVNGLIRAVTLMGDDLHSSVATWARSAGVEAEYDAVCPGDEPCAEFILTSLDGWAAWYKTNN
ncbi:MAG: hypothetical protein WBM90_14485 [Acidimicrobiia bacterium]